MAGTSLHSFFPSWSHPLSLGQALAQGCPLRDGPTKMPLPPGVLDKTEDFAVSWVEVLKWEPKPDKTFHYLGRKG